MSILSWNCRGLGSAFAVRAVKDVVRSHRPSILCLLETKRSVKSWDLLRVNLGFPNCFAVDRVGLSGGLAVLWKEDVELDILNFSRHHIHMKVDLEGCFDLTLFYGNPMESKRKESWLLLQRIWNSVNGPWMVTGDFNEVFFSSEVSGGRMRDSANMRRFREVADRCGLIDMKYQGSQFTFTNKRLYPFEYKARLDRVLANFEWKERFNSASVLHATAIRSDHCPVLTNLVNLPNRTPGRVFHYEAMWHRHTDFSSVMENVWIKAHQQTSSLSDSLKICAQELQLWNKNTFGHVNRTIVKLKAQLESIRSKARTIGMAAKEKEIVALLDEWQEREEWLWRQRSRVDWLKEGDRNSRYFHAKASQRKKTNMIKALKTEDGNMVYSQREMKQVVTKYFEQLYKSELMDGEINWAAELQIIEPKITDEMNAILLEPVTNEEIKSTLFRMNPSKAPGLDGFPALFYQRNWNIVGEAVCKEIIQFFSAGAANVESNLTRIALIPKCKDADDMTSFRPISLCPVIMRIASKILAGRLQSVLPTIISDSQSAFIKGRLISDNILIAHELSHFIKSRKGKYNGLASLKLDMSKAFDRLEWTFIERMLLRLGFADQWVRMIMRCVRTVSYKAQINQDLTDTIFPSRGIRQGDPISPYLFIICAEWLATALKNEMQGITITANAPSISHLFFADDSLVFSKARIENFNLIKSILLRYQKLSGQKVNFQKSEVVFSPNVDINIRHEICQMLSIPETSKHSQYLGLPLIVGQSKQAIFRFIEEKSHKRVSDWKSKLLSSAGKETLMKAVLQAIPQYAMSCYKLPLTTCNRMGKILTQFWWRSNSVEKPIHWIRRDVLFRSKENGGLGLRCPIAMNDALLLKQAWRILVEPELLMSKVFKAKYFQSSDLLGAGSGSSPSHAWRSIVKIKHNLLRGMELIEGEVRPIWKLSSCGDFTTKSAYQLIRDSGPNSASVLGEASNPEVMRIFWRKFWKLRLPGKLKIFGWRALHNGLPVTVNLFRRGIQCSTDCVFCGWQVEDVCHLFRDCWWAKAVGVKLGISSNIFGVSGGSLTDWFCWCEKVLRVEEFRNLVCASWCIWHCRNDLHHDKTGWTIDYIVAKVHSITAQWDKYATKIGPSLLLSDSASNEKVFCDGSWTSPSSTAGMAAIWLGGETIEALSADFKFGIRSSRDAEGASLLLGLKLAASLQLTKVTFYSDSVEVVSAIFNGMVKDSYQPDWIAGCSRILADHKGWQVAHCLREHNKRADGVANFARLNSWSWRDVDAIPRIYPLSG